MNKKSRKFLVIILIVFIGLSIFGLMNQKNIEKLFYSKMPDKVSEISLSTIDYLLEGKVDLLLNLFVDEYKKQSNSNEEMNSVIKQLETLGKPLNRDRVGYQFKKTINNEIQNEIHKVTYQLEFNNLWMIYSTTIVKRDNEYKLYRFDFNAIKESLLETNKFSLKNKGFIRIGILLLGIIVMIFTFYTSAIRFGSDRKRRILWTFLILCGIGSLNLNWTTGEIGISLFRIGFPCFTFGRAATHAPFVFGLKFPLFAIIYWVKRCKQNFKEVPDELDINDVIDDSSTDEISINNPEDK